MCHRPRSDLWYPVLGTTASGSQQHQSVQRPDKKMLKGELLLTTCDAAETFGRHLKFKFTDFVKNVSSLSLAVTDSLQRKPAVQLADHLYMCPRI